MAEATLLLIDLPAGSLRKVAADSLGGLILSNGGLARLRGTDCRFDQTEAQVICIGESYDPKQMIERSLAGTWDIPPDGPGRRGLVMASPAPPPRLSGRFRQTATKPAEAQSDFAKISHSV